MLKTIILLTKSKKHGGYCTAGIDVRNGEWIRIVSNGVGCETDEIKSKQLSYANGKEAEVLDVIEIKCTDSESLYFQPENYVNDSNKVWKKIRQADLNEIIRLHPFEKKDYIYFDTGYSIEGSLIAEIEDNHQYSLIFIKVINPTINVKTWESGNKSVTLSFCYNCRYYNYFRITDGFDIQYRDYDDGNYTVFGQFALVISLGELHTDKKHYKLIAKVFRL